MITDNSILESAIEVLDRQIYDLELSLPDASLQFPQNVLSGIEGDLSFGAGKLDESEQNAITNGVKDDEIKGHLENAPVFDFTVSANGAAVEGAWESSFGGTVWTFVPKSLKGSTEYTITVPKGFKGDNGAAMAESAWL